MKSLSVQVLESLRSDVVKKLDDLFKKAIQARSDEKWGDYEYCVCLLEYTAKKLAFRFKEE